MEKDVAGLIEQLYNMILDAWGLPLGVEKCVIERDKALNLIDDIKNVLPAELAEAQRLVAARAEFINNAKREAESIRKAAEDRARQMIDQQEVVRQAKSMANSIVSSAEAKSAELRKVANEYADDCLKRTEEAISEALNEVHGARGRFRSVAGVQSPAAPANDLEHFVPDVD